MAQQEKNVRYWEQSYEMTKDSAMHGFTEKECAVCGGTGYKRCLTCGGSGKK